MKKQIVTRYTNQDEEDRKQVCMEQLAQDRQQLLLQWPFIGGIIMRMELIPVRDDRLDTACTDGDSIFIDIDFYSKLTKDERLFVLAHEVWHSVLLHFARRQNRNSELFNIATDLEIHFTLEDENMHEPFVLPHDKTWGNLSAEEIYERLPGFLKNQAMKEQFCQGKTKVRSKEEIGGHSFGNGNTSFDKHIYKDDVIPEPNGQGTGDGEAENEGNPNENTGKCNQKQDDRQARKGNSDNDGKQPEDEAPKGTASNLFIMDKDYNPHVSSEAVERSRSRTIASTQQMERRQGTLPANIQRLLNKLQKPSLPWQEMLKQFVTSCYGGKRRWLPPARRHVWQDLYLPSMRDEALRAVVALDTSESTQGDLPIFFAELVSLMKSFGKFDLDVIQCDAEVQNVEHYSEDKVPPPDKKWKAKGLGGTDFRPVFNYIQNKMRVKPDLLLFFTDGYGDAPKQRPSYPMMWVLTENGRQPAEWGRVVHFKKKENNG